ncbi:MAG: Gfo/Idh/MocA family oxidoreductase [Planctomycetota bacterium]
MAESPRRIGLVDYDPNNFHADVYLKMLRGPLVGREYVVAGVSAQQEHAGRGWAAKNDVPYFAGPAEMNEAVDCFAVLAPSNPEVHEELCRAVLPLGKATFVDKTFAPDVATAERIFALADEHGVAVQTTSALRTTLVQRRAGELENPLLHMAAWAGGSSFGEYGIHPVEMVVSCMGAGVESLMVHGPEEHPQLVLRFSGDRAATIDFNPSEYVPFSAALTTRAGTEFVTVDDAKLFEDAAAAILDFFDAGRPLVEQAETLAVLRVLAAAAKPEARGGFVPV